jgi:hypothetical protein
MPPGPRKGTNDRARLVDASQVDVFIRGPGIRVFDEFGSGTLTVRSQANGYVAVLVRNSSAIARVTALTAPSGF